MMAGSYLRFHWAPAAIASRSTVVTTLARLVCAMVKRGQVWGRERPVLQR
jgi:hypothetical protein